MLTLIYWLHYNDYIFDSFEKYISGNYLGELVRTVLETLWNQKLFLKNAPPERFPRERNFTSDLISLIEQ